MRGKGDKPSQSRRRRTPAVRQVKRVKRFSSASFSVRIEYPDYSSEILTVTAPSFVQALDRGIEERKQFKIPLLVAMRKR